MKEKNEINKNAKKAFYFRLFLYKWAAANMIPAKINIETHQNKGNPKNEYASAGIPAFTLSFIALNF